MDSGVKHSKFNALTGLGIAVVLVGLLAAWLERKPGLTLREFQAAESGSVSLPGLRVAVNSAGAEDLAMLPGIGPTLAQRIIEYREQTGAFATPADLEAVYGLGPKKVAAIKDLILLE